MPVHIADILVVAVYLAGVLWLGLRVARSVHTTEDYFLAGRSLLWPFVGLSLFATNVSSSTIIGLAGDAYTTGIVVYNYEWSAGVILIFYIIVFLPLYLKTRIYTIPEFLEGRYDARARYYTALIMLLGNVLLETAGALYAGALVLQQMFPAWSLETIIWVLALAAGIYTAAGGLKSVVYTDVIQAVFLLLGASAVAVMAGMKVGSLEAVRAATSPDMWHLIRPPDDPVLPWPALLTGIPLLGIYYWCNNQYIVQRTLGARDLDQGRRGALLTGFLKVGVLAIFILPGLMGRVLYPDLPSGDQVFPRMVIDLLPVGVRGAVLVALVAALMSSIDSTLNAAATLITMDFVRKWNADLSQRTLIVIGRVATVIIMLLGTLWAPHIQRFPSLWKYLQAVLAYISPPIVACMLIGVFWARATASGAFAALVTGAVLAVVLLFFPPGIHFLYVAFLLFLSSALVLVLVSLLTAPPDPAISRTYCWRWEDWVRESERLRQVPWYQNYRMQALALLLLIAGVVLAFA